MSPLKVYTKILNSRWWTKYVKMSSGPKWSMYLYLNEVNDKPIMLSEPVALRRWCCSCDLYVVVNIIMKSHGYTSFSSDPVEISIKLGQFDQNGESYVTALQSDQHLIQIVTVLTTTTIESNLLRLRTAYITVASVDTLDHQHTFPFQFNSFVWRQQTVCVTNEHYKAL